MGHTQILNFLHTLGKAEICGAYVQTIKWLGTRLVSITTD